MTMNNEYSFVRKQTSQSVMNLEIFFWSTFTSKSSKSTSHSNLPQSTYCKEHSLDVSWLFSSGILSLKQNLKFLVCAHRDSCFVCIFMVPMISSNLVEWVHVDKKLQNEKQTKSSCVLISKLQVKAKSINWAVGQMQPIICFSITLPVKNGFYIS